MIDPKTSNQELTAWRGNIPVENLYTVGIAGDAFFRTLKDKGRLVGTKCPTCGKTYVPARLYCEACFEKCGDPTPLPLTGTVTTFTVCRLDLDGKPLKEPQTIAHIAIDGAEGGLVHRIADAGEVSIGMRVEAVLAKKRTGSINDIVHFRPTKK